MLSPEKLRMLRELDVQAAIRLRQMEIGPDEPVILHDPDGKPATPETLALVTMHKARLMMPQYFTQRELEISRTWLTLRGYTIPRSRGGLL